MASSCQSRVCSIVRQRSVAALTVCVRRMATLGPAASEHLYDRRRPSVGPCSATKPSRRRTSVDPVVSVCRVQSTQQRRDETDSMYYFVDSNNTAATASSAAGGGGGKQKTTATSAASSATAGAAPAATAAATTKGSKSRNMTDKFTREEEITLIEFVCMHKCLYDSTHKDYKDSVIKENVWKVIAFQMDGKTTEDCKKRWRSIRDTYKRLKKNSKPIKWPLWNHLLFLGDIPDERRPKATNGTVETTEETVYTTKFEEQYQSPNTSPKRELVDGTKDNELDDDIDIFYKSIALSVKHLPPNLVAEAKIQHLNILNSLQLQATQQQHTTIVLQPSSTKQEFVANVRY